jgi:hypothetical protein
VTKFKPEKGTKYLVSVTNQGKERGRIEYRTFISMILAKKQEHSFILVVYLKDQFISIPAGLNN